MTSYIYSRPDPFNEHEDDTVLNIKVLVWIFLIQIICRVGIVEDLRTLVHQNGLFTYKWRSCQLLLKVKYEGQITIMLVG